MQFKKLLNNFVSPLVIAIAASLKEDSECWVSGIHVTQIAIHKSMRFGIETYGKGYVAIVNHRGIQVKRLNLIERLMIERAVKVWKRNAQHQIAGLVVA